MPLPGRAHFFVGRLCFRTPLSARLAPQPIATDQYSSPLERWFELTKLQLFDSQRLVSRVMECIPSRPALPLAYNLPARPTLRRGQCSSFRSFAVSQSCCQAVRPVSNGPLHLHHPRQQSAAGHCVISDCGEPHSAFLCSKHNVLAQATLTVVLQPARPARLKWPAPQ